MTLWVVVWSGGLEEPEIWLYENKKDAADRYDSNLDSVTETDWLTLYEVDTSRSSVNGLWYCERGRESLDEIDQTAIFEKGS